MTETIVPVTTTRTGMDELAQRELAVQMAERACAAGIDLVGPGGLLTGLTKQVLETALEEELSEHLGTTSTTRWVATGRTPATAPAPRRC